LRNIAFLKHIAVIVSVMLFFEQAVPSEAHAALPSVASSPIVYQTPLLDRFEIPEQFAKTARHYSGTRDKTVLLIQDAHVHQAAQKSIAGALTYFVDHHQLKQVYVEGADGDLDTEMYSFFPNKKALSHVANYYLDQGRLTGAEFASIVIRPKLKLQGIEDKRLYEKNRQAYLEVLETKENYSELIQGFEKVMKQLSRFILPEDLRELSHRRYEGQDQNFQNYARYIIDLCRKQKISLKAYPSIQEYAELGQGESDINEAMAKKEFLHLLKRIETIIPEPIKEVWLDGSSQINLFNLKVNSFLKFLKENKPEIYAYLPRDYAHLNNFFRHVNFAENSAEDFLMELEEVTRTIEATFKVTEEQAYFLEMYRVLEVYKKMFKLNLTKEDVRYFQYHRESFNVQEIIQFLKPQLEKYKFAFDLPENFKDIESGLSKVEKFYTIALNRDQVLASRAVEGMEKDNENLAAMIVGGFHVPGIEAYLREQGYSYLVLTPQMKQLGDMQSMDLLYHEAMTHKPMDVEKNVQSFSTWVQGEQINDTYFQLVPELFVVTKNRMTSIPQSTLDFYQLATLRSLFNPEVSPAEDLQRLKSAIPFRRERFLEYALSGLSPGVLEKRANGNHLFWKPIASEKVGEEYFQLMGQVRYISADFWHTIGSFQPRSRSVISWGEQDHFIYVRDIDSAFVPEQVRSELHGNVSAQQPQSDSQFFLFRETRTSQRSDSSVKTLESDSREVPIKPLQHFFPASQRSEESNVAPEVAAKSEETVEAETETPAVEVPVEEIKPEVVGRVNVIPELISIAMVTFMGAGLVALPIYFVITRVLWVSAFLSHGFGHVLFKRLVDRNHKIEWAEASEGFSFKSLVKNLLPFSPLYTPWISPAPQLIPTGDTHPVKVAFKALGGPLSNFFGAAIFLSLLSQGLFNPYLSFTLATGFLVYTAFALLSVSDYSSFFRGAAECGYGCGILWVTAERDEGDDSSPYPKRIESVLSNVLYYMSLFGSHGVGAAAQFVDQRTGELDYTHFKMPSGYGQNPFFYQRVGRTALIQQFLQFFKTEVSGAESRRAVAGKRWNIAGHVRLKTSGGKLEVETTQPFYINPGEKIRYWSQEGNQMVMHEVSNIAYSAANGDNQKARLPGDQEGPYYGEEEWGKFFSKIYGVPIGANDSEKAGYMIYFLRTAGSLRDSLRLAYLATFFKSLNDPIPSTNQFEKWARLLEPMIEKYGLEDWSNPELLNKIVNEAITILPRDESATRMPQENYHLFLEYAFRAFQKNDGYQAAKTMMTMVNEYSTYGLFYESTLEPGVRVVISREQPVAIAENLTKKIQLGGSSLNFLKISLWRDTSYEQGDRLRTLKLDMTKAHDDHGGEIARLNYNHGTTEMYSMNLDRELSAQEVEDRWKDATNDKPDWIAPTLDEDPMLNDLMVSLAVAKAIRRDWTESPDNDASALSAARAFSKRWAQNARKLDRSNRVLQDAGIDVPAQHAAPDLFIVVFREENITVGEWFRKLMQETYPLANIKIVNGNEYIQSIESYPLYLNTNTFFIDLGFNFPIIRTAEEHERRAKKNEAVTLGESSDLWGTDAAKTQATWNVLKLLEDRKPPHTFILTPTQGTNISESFDLGSAHVISSKYFPDVDGGTGVSWSQIISLLELYHYVLKDMRREFPEGAPLGMTLSQRDIRGIQKSYEHMIRTDIPEILGFSLDAKNKVTQLDTPAHQNLERLSEELLPYFTEQVRATALSTVHLLVAVAFTGTVIQIAAAVVLNGFGPLWGLPSLVLSFLSHLFDVPLFLFFKWMSVIYFRLSENRELLHRDQNPAIVIGDDQWSRLIRVNLSKMFALAKGIVSPTGIYDSKQLSELEGKHGHDARRGTMIFLSGPPNRTTSDSVAAGHQGVGLIQSQAESFASINAVGPLIVGIMDSPESRVQSMKLGHQASIHSQSREAVQGAEHFDNPQKAGRLLEIAMGGPLRMLAHQVVFVNIVKKLQHLKLAYPLSWHRGDNQNSIGATTQAPIRPPAPEWISGAEKIKKLLESLKKPFARTPQPRAEEDVSATTDTEVRIERKLPGGILLSKDGHRPGKRSELRSIPDPAKLSIEALEKRNMLSGDLAKLSPDVSEIPTTDTVEVAKSFEQAVASKERAVIQIVGSEEVSYDPQGKTVEIAIRYNSGDEAFEFRLVNFISDSTGKTKSFYLIELKNGNFVQLLEGGITKYNAEGKALEGEVIDSASNRTLKFFFATSKNPLPNKQELVLVVSKMVITTETTRTEVKINLKNISFVEAEDGEEEVAKKAEPERVLEPERPIFPKENPLVSQAGPSSSVAPASDGTDSSVKIDDDPSIGLSPDDAMKLLPKVPDITAPIVDVAEGVMDDVIPLGEIEELVLEDGQVEGEAVEKTVALVPLTPAVHVVTNKSSNLSNQRDYDDEPSSFIVRWFLGMAAILGAAFLKIEKLFSGAAFPVLFISGAAFYSFVPASLWVFAPGLLGFFILATFVTRGKTDAKPQVSLGSSSNVLLLYFPKATGIEIKLPNGKKNSKDEI
jgi:hypothetical protein